MTPNRDSATRLLPVSVIDPAVYSADSVPTVIDLLDAQAATLVLTVCAGGIAFSPANKIEVVLTHSADGVTFTPVMDMDLIKDAFCAPAISNGIVRSLTAPHAATDVQKLGYVGGLRYLKLLADFSGTHGTGTAISAVVLKQRLSLAGTI